MEVEKTCSAKEARKITGKLKRYIYLQSFCIVLLLQQILSVIIHFSWKALLFNGLFVVLWAAAFAGVTKKKTRYIGTSDYENFCYDKKGREFLIRFSDRYTKKFINTLMAAMAVVCYILLAMVISVLSARYTFSEVTEQLFYASLGYELVFYLLIKNYLCKRLSDVYFTDKKRKQCQNQLKWIAIVSAVYFVIVLIVLCVFRTQIKNIYYWLLTIIAVYGGAGVLYNLTLRKNIVFKNLVFNLRRVVCISLTVSLVVSYKLMSMDFYFTQNYINSVSRVETTVNKIDYNEENGVYTITTEKDDFKILQLTDIHLGGSIMSYSKDLKALEACDELIQYTKPDLVVVTGDLVFPLGVMSFSLNNNAPIMQFSNFMRNTGVPWAFTYGNHDTEALATLDRTEFDQLMKSLSFKNTDNLLYPYVQPDIYGRSNQRIEIRNTDGFLMQELFLLDSNDYVEDADSINEYDYIHDDQVAWYRKNVDELSEQEGYTIPSMLFFHMPLREYKTANDLYESGSSEVKYYYGILGETMIDKICCSKYESKLFETAVELGSTKAMFCGHDHYNNQSLEYKGIRLSYGYSIDYLAMPGIAEDTEQRGGTLITIGKTGDFTITPTRLMDIQ